MKRNALIFGVLVFSMMFGGVNAQNNVMFNYQGKVKIQGVSFNGTGQFKFAIVNNPGTESLWSNDNTSVGGNQPSGYVSVTVTDGIFNVMVGDPDAGMDSIARTIFNHPNQIKLRLWFNDGDHGFQHLLPDKRLVNVDLIGLVSGSDENTLYVNPATGNDENT